VWIIAYAVITFAIIARASRRREHKWLVTGQN
jgi:hypothetical protein